MIIKTCSKCGIEKPIEEFPKRKDSKDGYRNDCKKCKNIYSNKWKVKYKKQISESSKIFYIKNRNRILKRTKKYMSENKQLYRTASNKWKKNNKDKISLYLNNLYKNDIQFNLRKKLRSRINSSLKYHKTYKINKTIELLGCDFNFYKKYLESLFTDGMSWELLLLGKIEIDHIKPVASFDLTKIEEQKKAFHYTNTQPLWAKDNRKKGAKIA